MITFHNKSQRHYICVALPKTFKSPFSDAARSFIKKNETDPQRELLLSKR